MSFPTVRKSLHDSGWNIQDHPVPTPQLWAGKFPLNQVAPKCQPCLTWHWALPGMGHPQLDTLGGLRFPGQVLTQGQPRHNPTQDFKITEDSDTLKFVLLWTESTTGREQQLLSNVCRTLHMAEHSQEINVVPVDLSSWQCSQSIAQTLGSPVALSRERKTSRSGCKLHSHLFLASKDPQGLRGSVFHPILGGNETLC